MRNIGVVLSITDFNEYTIELKSRDQNQIPVMMFFQCISHFLHFLHFVPWKFSFLMLKMR